MPEETATVQQVLAAAARHLAAGQLPEAEQLCVRVLQEDPRSVEAAHLLGVVALRAGAADRAVALLGQASSMAPDTPAILNSLGMAHRAAGQLDEAGVCLRRALTLAPDDATVQVSLGDLAQAKGDLARAEEHFQRALELQPDLAMAHYDLGNLYVQAGVLDQAVASYQRALELDPDDWVVHSNLGLAYKLAGDLNAARASLERALELDPGNATVSVNLASVHTSRGAFEEAEALCREAAVLMPGHPEPHNCLGLALRGQGRLKDALQAFLRALTCNRDDPKLHVNLGDTLCMTNAHEKALECYGRSLDADPAFAQAELRRAFTLLQTGDLSAGWRHLGFWRRMPEAADADEPILPAWTGEDGPDKTLLLLEAGGLAETLLLLRYLPALRRRFARVLLACDAPLRGLLAHTELEAELVALEQEPPRADVRACLDELPTLLGLDSEPVPAGPCLQPDPARLEHWRERLGGAAGLKVGLAWAGLHDVGQAHGSVPPALAGLFERPGVSWFGLHAGASEIDGVVDLSGEQLGPADTLACLRSLDLLVTPDTAAAHLAAAAGCEVWVLLERSPWWGWGLKGDTSPWYPGARLFRQEQWGRWADPMEALAAALDERIATATT